MSLESEFKKVVNASDRALAGEVMSLTLSGKVKSPKAAEKKARLALAVERGEIDNLRKLFAEGMSPNDPVFDDCLLTRAIWRGQNEALVELLKAGATPNVSTGSPPLLQAVSQSNTEAVRVLLEAGANPNVPLPSDQPTLLLACLVDAAEIVDLLLARKAKTNLTGTVYVTQRRGVSRVTPLMAAAWAGSIEIVGMLLATGADTAAKDSEGCTVLDWANRSRKKKARAQITETILRVCNSKDKATS